MVAAALRYPSAVLRLAPPLMGFARSARPAQSQRRGRALPILRARDSSVPLEADQRAHRHVELAQLVGAAELRQVDDEAGGKHLRAELTQQLDGAFGGTTGRDQIV